jgi:hypothetical protein
MISPLDWDNLQVTDDPAEAVRLIVSGYEHRSAAPPAEPAQATD